MPFEREGFGLAVLEALACDVPVVAMPTGIHAEALAGIDGTLCAEWDPARWSAAIDAGFKAPHGRIAGRARAERWSADAMAARVLEAWRTLLAGQAAS